MEEYSDSAVIPAHNKPFVVIGFAFSSHLSVVSGRQLRRSAYALQNRPCAIELMQRWAVDESPRTVSRYSALDEEGSRPSINPAGYGGPVAEVLFIRKMLALSL